MMWSIQELREQCGWSREELAQRVGVTRMAIWHWEAGDCVPRADQFRRLARTFGVSMDQLALPREDADADGAQG